MDKTTSLILVLLSVLSLVDRASGQPDLCDGGEEYRSFSPRTVSEGRSGQDFGIQCHVQNKGDVGITFPTFFSVAFYASTDKKITSSDWPISTVRCTGIRAGGSLPIETHVEFPTNIPAGTYYVGWIIDADEEIHETSETNNTAYKQGYWLTVRFNTVPVATADAYSTAGDTPLTIAAPGVLTNDTDPDGDPLTATLDSDPSHGTLVLNTDGSFEYTPDAGFSGTDTFIYYAEDDHGAFATAIVTITVESPPAVVPDVVGKSLLAAQSAITSAGLIVGTTSANYSDTVPAGSVISQNPAAGTLADPGSAVDLVMSLGPEDGPSEQEACCFADGTCQDLTSQECLAQGGTPQGEGTTCATTDCQQPPAGGLMAHYELDEGTGTSAADASGNGHHGTAQNGAPTWVDGQEGYGTAMHWDGLNPATGWINCGTWNPSAATGQLTVATWTKWDGPNGWHQGLIGKRDAWDDEGTQMMWYLAIDKDGHDVRFERGGSYPSCGGIVLPEGEWSHVAATFDGTTLIFYVDGVETGRDDFSFGAKTDATITLGCIEGGGWNGFNGALDDIRLYDYQLTLNEIKALAGIGQLLVPDLIGMSLTEAMAAIASAGLTLGAIGSEHSDTIAQGYVGGQNPSAGMSVAPGSSVELTLSLGPAVPETEACCYGDGSCADLTASECTDSGGEPQGVGTTCATTTCPGAPIGKLVAHWKLDEAGGTMAYDSSGNGNNGTLMGDPAWQLAGGQIDGALALDGIDDYVDCGNAGGLDITDEITIAAWVKANDAGNFQHNPYVTKGHGSYALRHHDENGIEFCIYDADWQVIRFPVDASFNGMWHHLAGTYDGSHLKLYVDGVLEGATEHAGSIGSTAFSVNIGHNSEVADRYYDGLIDDVRIYDYALSGDEIVQLVCTDPPPGDADGDCEIDFIDLAILVSNWLRCDLPVQGLCGQ